MKIVSLENKNIYSTFTPSKMKRMKANRIIYYVSTGLFTLIMLFSVSMYLTKTEMIKEAFTGFGYPAYLVYPLAIAKILGLVALWGIKSKTIKEWAYAGFFFNIVLAFFAHVMIHDGEQLFSLLCFIFLTTSYLMFKKLNQ